MANTKKKLDTAGTIEDVKGGLSEPASQEVEKSKAPVRISDDVLVDVKNCFHGKLYYKNPISGELVVWDRVGEVQTMTMRELRAMKARQLGFFKNQWIAIVGVADSNGENITPADIYKNLVITQYYKNFIDPDNFEEVCNWTEAEIAERIPAMSQGVKDNLIVALNDYILSGKLDSRRKIKAFEQALDCELAIN